MTGCGRRTWTSSTSSSGSVRWAARRRTSWPSVAIGCWGSSSSSSATHAAPRTTRRGSFATATTRPGYVTMTFAAYDDWASLESDSGETLVTQVGGLDLFPPDAAIPVDDYTTSMAACGVDLRESRRGSRSRARWPQFALPPGTVALYQDRARSCLPARGTAAMQAQARRFGAELRDETPVLAIEPVDGRRAGAHRGCDVPGAPGRRVRRRVDEPGARRRRPGAAAHRDAGAGDLLPARRCGAVPARPDAALDLDGRPVVLRLPLLRRGNAEGGPRLQRDRGDGRRPALRPRSGAVAGAGRLHGRDDPRLGPRRYARRPACTR